MAYADTLPKQRAFGETTRPDAWWVQPLVVFLGFSVFIIYSTWAAFHPLAHANGACTYWYGGNGNGGQLSLAVLLAGILGHVAARAVRHTARLVADPGLPFSAAFLILWVPAGFRFTCYYYRGAYYKSFWADPINCAVGEPRKSYLGERSFPLIIQNIHRYFLYLAVLFIFCCRMTLGSACGSRTRRGKNISASASAPSC